MPRRVRKLAPQWLERGEKLLWKNEETRPLGLKHLIQVMYNIFVMLVIKVFQILHQFSFTYCVEKIKKIIIWPIIGKSTCNIMKWYKYILTKFRMKTGAVLINISRGGIINQDDLYNALKENQVSCLKREGGEIWLCVHSVVWVYLYS